MSNAEDKLRRYDEALHDFLREMDRLGQVYPDIGSLSNAELRVWHNSKEDVKILKDQFNKVKSLYQKLEKAYQDLDLPHTNQ